MISSIPSSLVVAAIVITFAYASYQDLVSREVPELSWIPVYLIVILNNIALKPLSTYSIAEIVLAMLPSVVYCALFVFGLMGGADLLAITVVSLAHLDEPLIPLLTFIFSSMISLPLVFINLVRNVTLHRKVMDNIKCVRGSKRVLYLVGKPITVASFLKKKFAFLHTYPSQGGFICSSLTDVNIDFEKQSAELAEALNKGLIKSDDHVVYSPALPHIVFIALSYIVSVVIIPYLRIPAVFP